MENTQEQMVLKLQNMGKGKGSISPSVYDIAWMARLNENGVPIGKQAVEWLRENQLQDGSWGEETISYSHERLVCTLAAAVALARQGSPQDTHRLEKAAKAIEKYSKLLPYDPIGETIGFEMIVPTLMAEAENLNLISGSYPYLNKLIEKRNAKISMLPNGFVNRNSTVIFSSEMIQPHEQALLDMDNMQEPNGSIGCSPAATVWYMQNVANDKQDLTLNFLEGVIESNGMAPYITPIDIFETAWSLWNIGLTGEISDEIMQASQPLLDFLEAQWNPIGLSSVSDFPVPDGDTTAMVLETLTMYGRSVDIQGLLSFQGPSYFYCYRIESNASISTNVHVYAALRQLGYPKEHEIMKNLTQFLKQNRLEGRYWNDKWHISPYYTSSHAVIALVGNEPELANPAADWLIETQQKSGGWGLYLSTPEETAYALQALAVYARHGGNVPEATFDAGRDWLLAHATDTQPFLWIGKSLYSPNLVIETAIQSALELTA